MEFSKQPKSMVMEDDLAFSLTKFRQAFELNLEATGASEKAQKMQAATWLHCIGEDAVEIYRIFELTAEQKQNKDALIQQFEAYSTPETNASVERHKLNLRVHGTDGCFETCLTELKRIAQSCDYAISKDSLIKDRLVCGIKDNKVWAPITTRRGFEFG